MDRPRGCFGPGRRCPRRPHRSRRRRRSSEPGEVPVRSPPPGVSPPVGRASTRSPGRTRGIPCVPDGSGASLAPRPTAKGRTHDRASRGRLLVRPRLPLGVDDLTLDARGPEGAAGRRALARHEPGGAQRGQGPARELPRAHGPVLGPVRWSSRHASSTARTSCSRSTPRWAPGPTRAGSRTTTKSSASPLEEVGLPAELADAAQVRKFDDPLRKSHAEGIGSSGRTGTPIVAFEGTAFFGPGVTPAPGGDGGAGVGRRRGGGPRAGLLRAQAHAHPGPGLRLIRRVVTPTCVSPPS